MFFPIIILSLLAIWNPALGSADDLTNTLVRQMMLDRWNHEETVRSEGCSGIKQVRHNADGPDPYDTETHTGDSVSSLHDHADSINTLGMGEFHAVLNGVNFRTRHNDYLLKMPHKSSKETFNTEDIPFPDVPPSVNGSVQEQIDEMRQYFKAFALQDHTIRDYRQYFTPVLTYLEGAWIIPDNDTIAENYPGERHQLEAKTWKELQDRTRFTAYSGTKESFENYAWLPRAVVDVTEDDKPVVAQWYHRIMAHKLKRYVSPTKLKLVDDLATRMAYQLSLEDYGMKRLARFSSKYPAQMDNIMKQVPGFDNYKGKLFDEAFGKTASKTKGDKKLNTAFYHRRFKVKNTRHRGFSDKSIYMAMTTQSKVVNMKFENCMNSWKDNPACSSFGQRWTYAIPMEIVYLTPLAKWNPHNIEYHGWLADLAVDPVTADGKDGSEEKPFNGSNSRYFFQTPAEFFADPEYGPTPADTTGGVKYVLDSSGVAHAMRGSGIRTIIPALSEDVGLIRQRYPVMPVHGEGSSVWKELASLKDLFFFPNKYKEVLGKDEN